MFKSLFFAATLLTSNVVFSGLREDCASRIAKFLFKAEEQEDYTLIFASRLNETEFLKIFKAYNIGESLESACEYLDNNDEELFSFKQSILAEYLSNAHSDKIPSWKNDLESDALKMVEERRQNISVRYEPVNEQEIMRQRGVAQEFEHSDVPSITHPPVAQLKEEISRLGENELQNLSHLWDGKERSAEQIKKNVDKVFNFLQGNSALTNLLNSFVPSDALSRFISLAEGSSQPSNTVFSGQGVSLGAEEDRPVRESPVQGESEKEENLSENPKKNIKKEEE